MGLILLEALLALVLLVGIVWWTMFSGRKQGELNPPPAARPSTQPPGPASESAPAAQASSPPPPAP